jgi:hypothetical protein
MPITAEEFTRQLDGAHARLLNQRETRRNRFFRDGLLGNGEIEIASETFHPADILAAMAAETCRIARAESDGKYSEETAETVLLHYPSPIALAFNAFRYGSKQPLARLGFMRDTWEAAVSVVLAFLFSECAARNCKIFEVLMRDGPTNNPRPIRSVDLFSEKVATRLGCIEGILLYARVTNTPLVAAELIPVEIIGEMRRLNDIRNGFSHEQTKSEKQAEEIIDECEPDLLDILADLDGLQQVRFYRLHGISRRSANTLEVEPLAGHAIARRVYDIPVHNAAVALCAALALPGDLDPTCVQCRDDLFLASPYLYCANDNSGHQTRILLLKRIRLAEAKATYEVSGYSTTRDVDLTRVQPEIDRVKLLMQP